MADDVTAIINAFRPSRQYRRNMAGMKCSMCGLGITAPDFSLVTVEISGVREDTRPIHSQCTSLLWDLQDKLRAVMDDTESDPEVADQVEAG